MRRRSSGGQKPESLRSTSKSRARPAAPSDHGNIGKQRRFPPPPHLLRPGGFSFSTGPLFESSVLRAIHIRDDSLAFPLLSKAQLHGYLEGARTARAKDPA